MNDYEMRFLADDRRARLLAEADRERRARTMPAKPQRAAGRRLPLRHGSLGLLVGWIL
jgi:hypothetical protein